MPFCAAMLTDACEVDGYQLMMAKRTTGQFVEEEEQQTCLDGAKGGWTWWMWLVPY